MSHFLDASVSVVGEASIVVQGCWWGLGRSAGWFGIAEACDYAAVSLGSAGGGGGGGGGGACGCKSVVLLACTHSLPLVDLWRRGG